MALLSILSSQSAMMSPWTLSEPTSVKKHFALSLSFASHFPPFPIALTRLPPSSPNSFGETTFFLSSFHSLLSLHAPPQLSLSLSFSGPGAFCPWLSRSNWISTREAHCQKYQDVLIKTDFVLKGGLFKTVRGTKVKKARRKNIVRLKNRYKSGKEVAKRHGERTRRKKGRS